MWCVNFEKEEEREKEGILKERRLTWKYQGNIRRGNQNQRKKEKDKKIKKKKKKVVEEMDGGFGAGCMIHKQYRPD